MNAKHTLFTAATLLSLTAAAQAECTPNMPINHFKHCVAAELQNLAAASTACESTAAALETQVATLESALADAVADAAELENHIRIIDDAVHIVGADLVLDTGVVVDYAPTAALADYVQAGDLADYAQASDLASYATVASLDAYAQASDLASYATVASLDDYAQSSDLDSYVLVSDLDGYATEAWVEEQNYEVQQTSYTVFVTVDSYTPNDDFGGLEDADALCQAQAEEYGISGTYMAWLSSSEGSPATRFTQGNLPYVRVNGTVIAEDWTEFTDEENFIAMYANGFGGSGYYWTATNSDGYGAGASCSDWTAGGNGESGIIGWMGTSQDTWSNLSTSPCSSSYHLLCVQQ